MKAVIYALELWPKGTMPIIHVDGSTEATLVCVPTNKGRVARFVWVEERPCLKLSK